MANFGEWGLKNATLSDKTAKKEYGVDREFIIKGINAGKLEYHHGSIYGAYYIRILRRQLEEYISTELGPEYLARVKNETELRKIKKEISEIKKRLDELQVRKTGLEEALAKDKSLISKGMEKGDLVDNGHI